METVVERKKIYDDKQHLKELIKMDIKNILIK